MAGEINLYDAFATDYDNEGLCVLQPLDWYHKEVGNADSVLTVIHPYDAEGRHALLERGCILKAEVPVRTVPEIQNGAIIQTAELWTVRLTATKTERYQYTRATGGHRMKRIPAGYEVTVVEKGEERYKIKTSKYGTGWIAHSALEVKIVDVPYETDSDIEAATPSVNVRAQLFRITDVEKDDDKITVTAWHISYDWAGNMVTLDFTGDIRGQTFLNGLVHFCVREHDFNAVTDIGDKRISAQLIRTNPIAAILGEGGFIQRYGGELIRDNFDLTILRRAGMDRGFTIEYAKNLTGITFNVSDDGVVTSIVPIGKNEDGGDLYLDGQIWVDAPNSAEFAVPRIKELQVEDAKVGEGVTEENARDRMLEAVQAEWDKGVHLPTMSVKVSFERLGDTAVYAQYKELEKCYLYDTVRVWHPKICGEQSLTVVSQTWNGMQQRYTECELGSLGLRLGNSKITNLQLPNNISGLKIAPQSIGGAQLGSETIATRHLQAGSVNTEALQADSVTAEKVNTESLFADNVFADSLYAKVGEFVKIVAGNIEADKIDVDELTANIVKSVQVSALMADFDKATVKNLVAQALFLEYGNGDEVHIKNLSVDYAQMVGATIGKLCIKSSDGKYYNIDVNADGSVTATDVSEEIGDTGVNGALTPDGKRVIVETSMTVDDLNAGTLQAIYAMINKLDAAMIDTDELVAREAFIQKLVTAEINSSGDTIELIAKKATQSNVYTGDNPPANPAEGQLWVDTGVEPTVMRSWMGYDVATDREIPSGELTADVVKFYPQTIRGDVKFTSEVESVQQGVSGKNILPTFPEPVTDRGITITPLEDGGLHITGTVDSGYSMITVATPVDSTFFRDQNYVFSARCNTGSDNGLQVRLRDANGSQVGNANIVIDADPLNYVQISKDYIYRVSEMAIRCGSGVVYDQIIYVQLESGSSATEFEAYKDDRPIIGRSYVDFIASNKNIMPIFELYKMYEDDGITAVRNSDGSVTINGTATKRSVTYVLSAHISRPDHRFVLPDGNYTISIPGLENAPIGLGVAFAQYGAQLNNSWVKNIGGFNKQNTKATFDAISTERYEFYISINAGVTVDNLTIYPQIELGSEATDYVKHEGPVYRKSFNETIYGGSYDWKTGVLTVTHQRIVFDGSKDENWFSLNGAYNAYAPVYNIAEVSDTLISNRFVNAPDIGVNYLSANQMRQGGIYTNLVFGNPNNISTEEWCASLSLNPIEVVYELAEPYTIQYDPQEIEIPDVEEVTVFSSSGGTIVLAKISGWDTITADTVALEEKMAEAVLDINSDIGNLQSQIDGNITTWFYKYPPTLENEPASKWADDAAKNNHLGDLFYDETTGYCYRFQFSDGVYGWKMIQDTDIAKALADAKNAQDTADNKRRVFYDTPLEIPTPPYDVGDLWVQGSDGDILRCCVARTAGATGSLSDWVNASKYTDDTVANETKEQIKLRVSGVDVEYAKNQDPDNHPDENSAEWSTTVPTWESGYYIWSRTVYVRGTAENPETVYSGYTCLTTATSKSVKNIQEEFYVSTSKTEPIDGAWTSVSPSWSAGTYLWIRFVITYDDDTSVRKDAFLDETWSAAERTMEIASAARDQADAALKAARDAVTLPDFERVIRVKPDGLHVGDNKTSSEVLIDSASVNVVVNGVTYSTFGPGFLQLGDDIRVRRPSVGGIAFSPIVKESGS